MTGRSGENESKVSREESGVELKVAQEDKGKTKKQSSRRRNQRLDGFKKDSRCCISSFLGSQNATGLDEIEAECESLIKAEGSTQDQKHARSKRIPSQEFPARLHTSQRSLKGETYSGNYPGFYGGSCRIELAR